MVSGQTLGQGTYGSHVVYSLPDRQHLFLLAGLTCLFDAWSLEAA